MKMYRRVFVVSLVVATAIGMLGLIGAWLRSPIARSEIALAVADAPNAVARELPAIPDPAPEEADFPHREFDPSPPGLAMLLGPPRWYPRPPSEWQGMLVNLNLTPHCDSSALCGLARACKDAKCMPCEQDGECADGEACVLDHCVRRELVTCRRSANCLAKEVCILSGYSNLPRGNEGMRAICVDPAGGTATLPQPTGASVPDTRTSLPHDDLLRASREAARAE